MSSMDGHSKLPHLQKGKRFPGGSGGGVYLYSSSFAIGTYITGREGGSDLLEG